MFRQIADQLWRRQGPGVRQLEANLARVIGPDAPVMDLRRPSRDGMRSYLRYRLEVFRLPVIPPAKILGRMRAAGEEQTAFGHLAAGRGVIFALPHMGNWEHAGAWIVLRGAGKVTTVAERLRPESLYDRFVAFREGLGMEVLPHSAGASRFGVLAQRLRAGGLVALLCERDLTGSGIEVEFFGEPARIMGGPAALAEQTGAALMPVTLWYEGVGLPRCPPTICQSRSLPSRGRCAISLSRRSWRVIRPRRLGSSQTTNARTSRCQAPDCARSWSIPPAARSRLSRRPRCG